MSSVSDSNQVEDAQAAHSIEEFAKRQVAVIERHIQNRILRGVGSRIVAGLRDTDAVGRISEDSFGVMVVDAVEGSGPMIVSRWESDLLGQLVDDGAGGMIEINLENSFRRCELTGLENLDSSEIAARLLSTIEQSLVKPS
jgi:hypothetical protein